jgi:hypothetical protein
MWYIENQATAGAALLRQSPARFLLPIEAQFQGLQPAQEEGRVERNERIVLGILQKTSLLKTAIRCMTIRPHSARAF